MPAQGCEGLGHLMDGDYSRAGPRAQGHVNGLGMRQLQWSPDPEGQGEGEGERRGGNRHRRQPSLEPGRESSSSKPEVVDR